MAPDEIVDAPRLAMHDAQNRAHVADDGLEASGI
jgi:hypothetical protein